LGKKEKRSLIRIISFFIGLKFDKNVLILISKHSNKMIYKGKQKLKRKLR